MPEISTALKLLYCPFTLAIMRRIILAHYNKFVVECVSGNFLFNAMAHT